MPVDILAFAPHPDDAEIGCGGLLRKLKDLGRTTGIIDMTSGDMGWGAWCVEAGWGQAWTAATLALRAHKTSLWDHTSRSRIASCLTKVQMDMARNNGSPLTR